MTSGTDRTALVLATGSHPIEANRQGSVDGGASPAARELPQQIYERLVPELKALPANELVAVNLDVPSVVITALGVFQRIAELRGTLQSTLCDFDAEQFDKLRDYAYALLQAHVYLRIAIRPADGLQEVVKNATQLRQTLLLTARLLVGRGLLPERPLKRLRRRKGYINLADDINTLTCLLRNHWSVIADRCGITAEDLRQSELLTLELMHIVGSRRCKVEKIPEAADMRIRAFTACTRAYDNIRRGIVYLRRHEGDAESLMPSLYKGHGGRARKPKNSDARQSSAQAPQTAESTSTSNTPSEPLTSQYAGASITRNAYDPGVRADRLTFTQDGGPFLK